MKVLAFIVGRSEWHRKLKYPYHPTGIKKRDTIIIDARTVLKKMTISAPPDNFAYPYGQSSHNSWWSPADIWAWLVNILVFPSPTGDMLTSSYGFTLSIQLYSIHSYKMIRTSPEVLNFNRLFLKLNQFICNSQPVIAWYAFEIPESKTTSSFILIFVGNMEVTQTCSRAFK